MVRLEVAKGKRCTLMNSGRRQWFGPRQTSLGQAKEMTAGNVKKVVLVPADLQFSSRERSTKTFAEREIDEFQGLAPD